MLKKITIGAALAASTLAVIPTAAVAAGDGYYNSRYERSYRGDRYQRADRYHQRSNRYYGRNQYRRCSGTTGTIVGGAAGALLGRELDGGRSRTTGTILGAAAGALLGREVGKSTCRR